MSVRLNATRDRIEDLQSVLSSRAKWRIFVSRDRRGWEQLRDTVVDSNKRGTAREACLSVLPFQAISTLLRVCSAAEPKKWDGTDTSGPSDDPATRVYYSLRENLQEGSGGIFEMTERLKEISKRLKSLVTRVSLLSFLRVREDMVDWADCLKNNQGDAWHKRRLTSLGTALAGLIVDADLTNVPLPDRILLQETQSLVRARIGGDTPDFATFTAVLLPSESVNLIHRFYDMAITALFNSKEDSDENKHTEADCSDLTEAVSLDITEAAYLNLAKAIEMYTSDVTFPGTEDQDQEFDTQLAIKEMSFVTDLLIQGSEAIIRHASVITGA